MNELQKRIQLEKDYQLAKKVLFLCKRGYFETKIEENFSEENYEVLNEFSINYKGHVLGRDKQTAKLVFIGFIADEDVEKKVAEIVVPMECSEEEFAFLHSVEKENEVNMKKILRVSSIFVMIISFASVVYLAASFISTILSASVIDSFTLFVLMIALLTLIMSMFTSAYTVEKR